MPKILIIDNDPVVRRVLAKTLTHAGFEVKQVRSDANAWDLLRRCPPDVLFTDVDLPRMSESPLGQLIEDPQGVRQYPVFVVTSKTAVEHCNWSPEIDNVWFVKKPFSRRKLLDQLNKALAHECLTQVEPV